jgi:radical SAM superfamily enzyme YgiQ (UPF0313 family)
MRIAFITLYDPICRGARMLISNLLERGHDAYLIALKDFRKRKFYLDDPDHVKECRSILRDSGYLPTLEFHIDHDIMSPYPTPVSPREKELLFDRIRLINPDMIGISVTSFSLPLAKEISALLRQSFPGKPLLWGGIHCILSPEDAVPFADLVCLSEADDILPDWLAHSDRSRIKGLWVRTKRGWVRNPRAPFPQDLDRLPDPFYGGSDRQTLIEDNDFHEVQPPTAAEYPLLTQRGCPFRCSYCFHSKVHEFFPSARSYRRRRSVSRVLDEMTYARDRFQFDSFHMWDDLFMIDAGWIEEFSQAYPRRFPGIPLSGTAHPRMTSPEMLRQLQKAGCVEVKIEVPTGSPHILREIYHRTELPDDVRRLGTEVVRAGIPLLNYEVFTNSAFELEEYLWETLHLLCDLPKPSRVSIQKVVAYPGSVYATFVPPKNVLPAETFHYYNNLYLLACQHGSDTHLVRSITAEGYYRKDLKGLEELVRKHAADSQKIVARMREEAYAQVREHFSGASLTDRLRFALQSFWKGRKKKRETRP